MTASGFTLDLKPKVVGVPTLTGTIELTIAINVMSKFGQDTWFPCAATVIGGQLDTTTFVLEGGVETANGIATVNKSGVGTCVLTIPYEWTVASDPAAVNGLIVAYAAAAIGHEGATRRSTLQVQGVDSLPAAGATTKLAFTVALYVPNRTMSHYRMMLHYHVTLY